MGYLTEYPQLISMNLEHRFEEFFLIFDLYLKFEQKDVIDIFKGFPYMICQPTRKMIKFCGQFKKYKMEKDDIKNLCINSGGLLGSKVKNFIGLFETL